MRRERGVDSRGSVYGRRDILLSLLAMKLSASMARKGRIFLWIMEDIFDAL